MFIFDMKMLQLQYQINVLLVESQLIHYRQEVVIQIGMLDIQHHGIKRVHHLN